MPALLTSHVIPPAGTTNDILIDNYVSSGQFCERNSCIDNNSGSRCQISKDAPEELSECSGWATEEAVEQTSTCPHEERHVPLLCPTYRSGRLLAHPPTSPFLPLNGGLQRPQ